MQIYVEAPACPDKSFSSCAFLVHHSVVARQLMQSAEAFGSSCLKGLLSTTVNHDSRLLTSLKDVMPI